MRNIINKLFLFLIIVLSLFLFCPLNSYAISN